MATAAYGRLYVESGVTAQGLHATPGTFTKISGFATAGITYGGAAVSTSGDTITLPAAGGDAMPILVHYAISFTVSANGLYRFAIFNDGVAVVGSEQRVTAVTTTVFNVCGVALTKAVDGVAPVIDLRAASDQVSPDITPSFASIVARQ